MACKWVRVRCDFCSSCDLFLLHPGASQETGVRQDGEYKSETRSNAMIGLTPALCVITKRTASHIKLFFMVVFVQV